MGGPLSVHLPKRKKSYPSKPSLPYWSQRAYKIHISSLRHPRALTAFYTAVPCYYRLFWRRRDKAREWKVTSIQQPSPAHCRQRIDVRSFLVLTYIVDPVPLFLVPYLLRPV
ncbi:hypothetical protein QR685DRAFT_516323 [Neurospora intermedia]|uniref:Uncharacterized protein n=1 Tax=Neurospora intermedia TaxID=5142 RepID=A0ABR3DKS6_NEUIN